MSEDFDGAVVRRRLVVLELFDDGIEAFEGVSYVFKFLIQLVAMPFKIILEGF